MVGVLTRRGYRLSGSGLFDDTPAPRPVDMDTIRRRQREREGLTQVLPPARADRYLSDPRFLVGLACPFNVLSSAKRDEDGTVRRTRFSSEAFDGLLWEIDHGLGTVGLWRRHDPERVIGTTADGSFLRLFTGDRGLMFAVDTETPRGSLVAHLVRSDSDTYGECSISSLHLEYEEHRQAGGIVVRDVTAATVREISLVSRGAMSGTWIR